MSLDIAGIGRGAEAVKGILGMFFSDKTEEEKARISAAFSLIQAQTQINNTEAANPSVWVSGWRPAVGWVCAAALGFSYIPKAVVLTGIWTYQCVIILSAWTGVGPPPTLPTYPDLGVTDLIGLLISLLGIGGMRTFEKINRVASK